MISRKRNRRKYNQEAVELNITAFLNLMVILIPFLLITAVFSKLAILELNLPNEKAGQSQEATPSLNLELVIKKGSFYLQDANTGLIRQLERKPAADNWNALSSLLLEIKQQYPNEEKITLLLEPDIQYKTLIKVMDTVKSTSSLQGDVEQSIPLFPLISISDAAKAPLQPLTANENKLEEAGSKK